MILKYLLVITTCSLPLISESKECPCEQHNAKGTGSGTCSIVEDSSYCTVTYSTGTGTEESARIEFAQNNSERYDMRILPPQTFQILNGTNPDKISPEIFRDILINIMTFSSGSYDSYGEFRIDEQRVERFISDLDIRDRLSYEAQNLHDQYRSQGCIRYESQDGYVLRILNRNYDGNPACS